MDRHVAFVFFFGNIQINWMLRSELLDGGVIVLQPSGTTLILICFYCLMEFRTT